MPNSDLIRRFWEYVVKHEDACWDWSASTGSHGYPQLAFQGSKVTGHTLSWRIHFGEIPKGLCVLHECDNRKCTNPKHLFLGTKKTNLEDMTNKGRRAVGSKHGRSKLTEDQVSRILSSSETYRSLSAEFGVSEFMIGCIKRRSHWKHVQGV